MLTPAQIDFLNNICKTTWKYLHGVINVKGNVPIYDINLTQIPVQFGHVTGYFSCYHNNLTTLLGCPKKIDDCFDCETNNLTTLKYGPEKVVRYYSCAHNQLTNLIGAPVICNSDFFCEDNQLTSLEGCPKIINGAFICTNNPNLHILYGIGKVQRIINYDNKNDLNEWIITRAQRDIFSSYSDIAKWIKNNGKYKYILYAQQEIRKEFSPRILYNSDMGIYNENFSSIC